MTASLAGDWASLTEAAVAVLTEPDARAKAAASRSAAKAWGCGMLQEIGTVFPPDRPGRPDRPPLRPPREVPRRRIGAEPKGRFALLHALAHIELNAIDLAWDVIARFATSETLPHDFFDDWIRVGDEEAKHFLLLADRLEQLGGAYGDLTAHDGLWRAAQESADDLLTRLAVVPLVLEARGLDVTPGMIAKLEAVGDEESARILRVIHQDEIGHVAIGRCWFEHLCARRGFDPFATFQRLVRAHHKGGLKPPFNRESRQLAGLAPAFYEPLVKE